MTEQIYPNQMCDVVPKLRIEMLGRRGVGIWLEGRYMGNGISKVEFIAEGSTKSPKLNISMSVGDFRFEPAKDLIANGSDHNDEAAAGCEENQMSE